MVTKYAYFLGCITPNRYPGIEKASIVVMNRLDSELVEMKGASCCPAPGVIGSFDLFTWSVIGARNLTIAEELGTDIIVTCNGCYATLQEANHLLKHNEKLRTRVNETLSKVGREYKGTIEVKHIIEVLRDDIGYDQVKQEVKTPLNGINVAVHYGCHFLKPSEVRGQGTSENPQDLDNLVTILGGQSVDYKDKLMCCGAGGGVLTAKADISIDITKDKVAGMKEAGADCLITPCAFCHLQFDRGISQLMKNDAKYELPVIFMTQLMGLAFDMTPEELGIGENATPDRLLLDKL
jgi:heterodisulfide reductase subunit B